METTKPLRAGRAGAALIAGTLMAVLALGPVPGARGQEPQDPRFEETPPRLSYTDGQVSFWRPGAEDWTRAQVNTPLAPGDALSTGTPGTLELQIGNRAFVRAWGNTQLSFGAQEPDFLQFTVAAGSAVFDLRTLDPGDTVEVDTPNAAITIQQVGYYRIDVTGERSRVMTRRGGRATVTPTGGQAVSVTPSEELVIEGTAAPQLAAYAAPQLDDWDNWNYVRTDRLLDAVSARYVAPGTYGVSDLDPYGTWRVVPTYGAVWVPTGVPAGWTPYSTGSWILDPVYGWTWVDTAPWGWAPYHHGRWCYVDGYWAWAPGPVIARPVYSPALVAFVGAPEGVVVGPVEPPVGWVALGWGEPVVPWWGPGGAAHHPSWRGWGGPRVVNNVVVSNTTVVNVQNITVYRNESVPHAVVAVDRGRFGHGRVVPTRLVQVDPQRLRPLPGPPQVSSTPASLTPTAARGVRPAPEIVKRLEVAPERLRHEQETAGASARRPTVSPRANVTAPNPGEDEPVAPLLRPSFGHGTTERQMTDRKPSPAPPRPSGAFSGSVPTSHTGLPTPAAPALKAEPGKEPAAQPLAKRPPEPTPNVPHAGPGPNGLPPMTHAAPSSPPAAQHVEPRPAPAPSHAAPAPPPVVRQGPSAPPGRAETMARPRTGGVAGAPTVTNYSAGHPPPAVTHSPGGPPATHQLPGEPANRLAPGRGPHGPTRPDQSQGQSR